MSDSSTVIDLEKLRDLVEEQKLKRDLASLEAQQHTLSIVKNYVGRQTMQEAWGDRVDLRDQFNDGAGMSRLEHISDYAIARATDRRNGDNYPFWSTEAEWRMIVGRARVTVPTSEVAQSALENLVNYTIGEGFGYTFTPKKKHENDSQAQAWAALCQDISDNFDEANQFDECERSLFCRSREDGEFFAALKHRGGKMVQVREVDPLHVTEPDDKRSLEDYLGIGYGLDWKYGVAAPADDSSVSLGYFCEWHGDQNDWDFIGPEQMVHLKLNVHRETKRGMSDFFSVDGNLHRADKLLGNTLEGAAVQAAIAYVREHAPGVNKDAIEDFVGSLADDSITERTSTGGIKTRNISNHKPGSIHDVGANTKYHAGPLGAPNGPRFIEVVQAALRMVGVRWTMPEYMISGDASNGNFASTLVAESPFTKSREADQRRYARKYREIKWKAVALVAKRTNLFGGASISKIKRMVQLTVDTPDIAVRDQLQDHQIRRDENAAGLRSLDTWANDVGLDLEEERNKGAAPLQINLGGGQGPQRDASTEPVSLNGAQITAVLDVLNQLTHGDIAPDIAVSMIKAVGVDPQEAQRIIDEQRSIPPSVPPSVRESWLRYP